MHGTDEPPGIDESFEDFVRGRSAHLFRLALLLSGGDYAAAQDLLQIALERAYRHRVAAFNAGSPEPYVRRILVNAAIDWRRMLRRRREKPLEDVDRDPLAKDQTNQLDDRDVLIRALAALPRRQRAVLVLRYWEDLSESEIASALDCSVGTVKSQASRGLARLRELAGASPAERPGLGEHRERQD